MAESVPQCGKSLGVTFQWRIKKCAFASSEQLKVITLRQSVSSIKLRPSLTLLFPLPYTVVFNNGYYFNISFLYKGKREVRLRVFFYSLLFLVAHLVKKSTCNVGDLGLISGLGRFPWRSKRLPTPVSWPGEFHGLYSPWGSQRFGHD